MQLLHRKQSDAFQVRLNEIKISRTNICLHLSFRCERIRNIEQNVGPPRTYIYKYIKGKSKWQRPKGTKRMSNDEKKKKKLKSYSMKMDNVEEYKIEWLWVHWLNEYMTRALTLCLEYEHTEPVKNLLKSRIILYLMLPLLCAKLKILIWVAAVVPESLLLSLWRCGTSIDSKRDSHEIIVCARVYESALAESKQLAMSDSARSVRDN